jgi:hypothetical protein
MGKFSLKSKGDGDEDSSRLALFGSRSKSKSPAPPSHNPYAQPTIPPDPYTQAKINAGKWSFQAKARLASQAITLTAVSRYHPAAGSGGPGPRSASSRWLWRSRRARRCKRKLQQVRSATGWLRRNQWVWRRGARWWLRTRQSIRASRRRSFERRKPICKHLANERDVEIRPRWLVSVTFPPSMTRIFPRTPLSS